MDWSFVTNAPSWVRPQQPRSRLLTIPAEIRALIFEFALTSDKPLVTFCLDGYQRDSYTEAIQPALTRVSRQIRAESLPIFYGCNDLILHTEGPRARHTTRCLSCIEPHLPKLCSLSIWVRYVTLTHPHSPGQGALSVSIRRVRPGVTWLTTGEWKWITVVRKPAALESDAKILTRNLTKLLEEEPHGLATADTIIGMLSDLKMFYVKEKMS